MVGWNIRGFTPEKLSDPQFHEYLKAGSIGASRTVGAEPTLIACVEPKRGGDPLKFKNYMIFHSPRTERGTDGAGTATVTCEDGGATLFVHDRAAGLVVRDHTSCLLPEVIAVECDKVLFSTSTNVIVVVAYMIYLYISLVPNFRRPTNSSIHITQRDWRLFLSFFALSVRQAFKIAVDMEAANLSMRPQ